MAITSDGTQYFGIEVSPVTISGNTYVCESLNFNFSATRADINDSNGEPLGATIIPGRLEVSATVQMAATTTPANLVGATMTLDTANSDFDGDYLLQDCSVAESQGDYVKMSINAYRKTN